MPDTAAKMSNHDRVIFLRERINSLSRQIEAEGLEEDYERYLAGLQNGSIKPTAIADAEWEVMLPGQRKKDFLAYYHARRCEWLELMKEGKPHGSRKRFIEWLQNPWVITRIAEAFTLVEGAVFILHSVQGMGFSLLPNEGTQADKPRLIPPDIASGLPMSAKDYLETLHTQGAGLQPLEDDQIDQLQRTYRGDRELTEEESRQFAFVRASMDAGDDHIQFIATQLISALPEEPKQKIASIPVGIVPIDAPNAMAQSPTGDPLIIIIQRGLHSLCFNVASACWPASRCQLLLLSATAPQLLSTHSRAPCSPSNGTEMAAETVSPA